MEKALEGLGSRKLQIEVRTTKKDDGNFCVQFTCKDGDKYAFAQAYKDITDTVLDFAVD